MNNGSLRHKIQMLIWIPLLLMVAPLWAQPMLNPANGHYYELISTSAAAWTWQQASNDAQSRSFAGFSGHLVTITSQQENDFLRDNLSIPQNAWIGATQAPDGSEPADGWEWVTGEAWIFTSWAPNEPNNAGGNEECGHWWTPNGTWNDIPCSNAYGFYVVEFGDVDLESRATFNVTKSFDDGNLGGVDVTISCTTGLPLEQTKTITEAQGVEFVLVDFDDGEPDCDIYEDTGIGYAASYSAWGDSASGSDDDGCYHDNVNFGDNNYCAITNNLQQVRVDVTKIWFDEHPEFNNPTYARADYTCSGEQFENTSGSLPFYGEVDEASFYVYPHWNGLTTCTVTEAVFDSAVVSDDSDCSSLSVTLGVGNECTITNTVFYQGIPTLSQYGLAVLALLMLGVGLVGFRRFA